ncbi:unnamed protein product [Cylicocyclus nassatus]|nr:unnamed protein product [Cylicocyclus nassatus]
MFSVLISRDATFTGDTRLRQWTRMRIFNLTFLLLTILVILDVGECGKFKDILGKIFGKIGETLLKVPKVLVKAPEILKHVNEAKDIIKTIKG